MEIPIKKICVKCNGTTIDTGDPNLPSDDKPCENCIEGYRDVGFSTLPTNVFYSHEVLEQLDATEHNALSDAQKEGVLHLLACGMIDLNTGKKGRVSLWNWFGAESTTVANLTALLG